MKRGAAIPALTVQDIVKEVGADGRVTRTLDRRALRLAQTPQGSRVDWLLEALDRAERDGIEVPDEASALEHAGRPVRIVSGGARGPRLRR